MKKKGKLVYIGFEEYKGLESVGKRFISKPLLDDEKKHVSYTKIIRFILALVQTAEKIAPKINKDEEE